MSNRKNLKPGQSCGHRGCLGHVLHPCEGCGRVAGHEVDKIIDFSNKGKVGNNYNQKPKDGKEIT